MICRICSNKISKYELKFKNYPISLWPCSHKIRNYKKDLKLFFCKKCSLMQLQRFSKEEINKFYENESKVLSNDSLLVERYKCINQNIPKNRNKKILEVGVGRNNILKYFTKSERWLADYNFDNNYKNFKLLKGDFVDIKLKKKYFDYIFFFHTLEHIEKPKKFLKKIFFSLKDEGKIFVEVPNSKIYLKSNSSYAFFFQHQILLTEKNLKKLMAICGFKFEKSLQPKKKDILLYSFLKSKKINFQTLGKDKNYIKSIYKKIQKDVSKCKKFIKKNKSKNIGIYGCGGTSLTLFYHLKKEKIKIKYFYDGDKRKINKFIPMTNSKVSDPKYISQNKLDVIIFTNNNLFKVFKNKYKKIKTLCLI